MHTNGDIGRSSRLTWWAWVLLAFFAVVNGLMGLRYLLPQVPFPASLPNFVTRHAWLVCHATFSSIALLAGPWQFAARLRQRALNVHRWLGRVYCGAVLAGWITSLPIAAHAQTGALASTGFLTLGAAWIAATAVAYAKIRGGRVPQHREWMIRSYSLTAAAITLRLYLPVVLVTHFNFALGYGVIAWTCWIPNLLVAEWLVRRGRSAAAATFRPAAAFQ